MTQPSLILHLGLGAFHRAHQAAYLQVLHDLGDTSWSLVSANIRADAHDLAPALRAQDNIYTLETIAPDGARAYRRISAITDALPWTADLAQLIAAGAHAQTRIISFTVTEAGYNVDDDGRLDAAAAEVQAALDDARAHRPGTHIYSVLTAILRARRAANAGPVTLLCCDNLRHNGRRVQRGLHSFLDLLGAADADLAAWVAQHTSCPNTMVDRITPRPAPELRARVRAATGIDDPMAVSSERYIQWVIEDDFRNGRPDWERVGAELVKTVKPYEEAKIRILNATHSCIAWAGALAGHQFIHEALADPRIHALAHAYVTHAVFDCLRPSPIDLERYRDLVLERFGSAAMRDTVERVLADSFSKLAGFVVPTLRERIARALPLDNVAVLPALFLEVLLQWQRGALATPYHDQARARQVVDAVCHADDPVAVFCAQPALWGTLAGNPKLLEAMRAARPQARSFMQPGAQA